VSVKARESYKSRRVVWRDTAGVKPLCARTRRGHNLCGSFFRFLKKAVHKQIFIRPFLKKASACCQNAARVCQWVKRNGKPGGGMVAGSCRAVRKCGEEWSIAGMTNLISGQGRSSECSGMLLKKDKAESAGHGVTGVLPGNFWNLNFMIIIVFACWQACPFKQRFHQPIWQ